MHLKQKNAQLHVGQTLTGGTCCNDKISLRNEQRTFKFDAREILSNSTN